MKRKPKLVLIGNGMAGVRVLEHVIKLAPDAYEISVVGAEPHPNYNRIMLSSVLAGNADVQEIVLNDWAWYRDNRIALHAGQTVTHLDTEKKLLRTDKGLKLDYDKCILATGSNPFVLPVPGKDKQGVIAFRDLKDCEAMIAAARTYRKAAVIGGGLLGLEAARGLLNLGMEVTVVHLHGHLMERQLDETAAGMLKAELEQQGMKFLLQKTTEAILGRKRVTALRFQDGAELETDLVVMAVGIRPNVELARQSGLAVDRGIVVDDYMAASVPDIYAVGECAEHRGTVYGLVAPLYEQGSVLAKRLAGVETTAYTGSELSARLKISGIEVFSAGSFADAPGTRSLRLQDEIAGTYKKIVIRGDRIAGAVLFGDTSDSAGLFSMIRSGEPVAGREKEILLGMPAGENQPSLQDKTAAMSGDELICGCNGVSKDVIMQAITEEGCKTVGDVKNCTKASGSCGGCKPLVESLLRLSLGEGAALAEKEGICACTVRNRDEVVEAIKRMGLKTVREVMHVLEWTNPEGCAKCRPALNYYLGMIWPEDYEDERASRIVNERFHANIQKDGTFSVVPRIYGGVTSPEELKKIALTAEKYQVPMVKLTGGQRIDLLGVKKEDLPGIWAELAMSSGYAYGKALRTVKTCVGATFCRFGTQDSMAMGIAMERRFERLDTPGKVKMAVSGCPRNCAESGIKDLGVVAIEGAWELYAGGNGGVKVRAGDYLATVKTEEDVLEWTGAYLQYYRETANWNERTSGWVERKGLANIREALADPENRKALVGRLDKTLNQTSDPWKQVNGNESLKKNFAPMAEIKSV